MTKAEAISVIKASGLFYIPAESAALHQSAISELEDALDIAIEALEQKTGYWVVKGGKYICSICGAGFGNAQLPYSFKFCPKCGGSMDGGVWYKDGGGGND